MTLESDAKFEEKLTFGLENNNKFHEFLLEHWKVGAQNWKYWKTDDEERWKIWKGID